MKIGALTAGAAGIVLTVASLQHAAAQTPPPRDVPARTIPVPDTVSPQMQTIIGAPINPNWNVFPKTAAEWKMQVDAAAAEAAKRLPALREQMRVKLEAMTINGVRAFALSAEQDMPAENGNRLLFHVHGGCYVSNPGEFRHQRSDYDGRLRPFQGDFDRLPDAARGLLSGGARRRDRGLEGGAEHGTSAQHGDLRLLGRWRPDTVDGAQDQKRTACRCRARLRRARRWRTSPRPATRSIPMP